MHLQFFSAVFNCTLPLAKSIVNIGPSALLASGMVF